MRGGDVADGQGPNALEAGALGEGLLRWVEEDLSVESGVEYRGRVSELGGEVGREGGGGDVLCVMISG